MKKIISILCLTLFFSSCNNDEDFIPQTEADIKEYIAEKGLDAKRTGSGIYYVINNEGTGDRPFRNANVKVAYKGYFLDGTVFDQSSDEGTSFGLNQVIAGWTEGIPLFREGGEGILIIPYQLGYGSSGRGSIPGGAVLIFDIKLIRIN